MELNEKELKNFEEKGYLVLRSFADPERCDAIMDIAKAHLKHKIPPIETESEYIGIEKEAYRVTVRRLRQVYDRDIVFRQWMEEERIRPVLRQVLHEDPVITLAHHNSIMTKMPFSSTETSWHQDIRYWRFDNDNLVSVWLALDEERSENGVLEFIPGSHKMDFSPDQFDEKEFFLSGYAKNRPLIATREQTVLHKGDVVLFHCKLLHRADKNRTEHPKISFVYTVRGASNLPLPGTRSSAYPEVSLAMPEK